MTKFEESAVSEEEFSPGRVPGRPRDSRIEAAVLDAGYELLVEGGVAACSVEAVSRRSGVGKPAIYRRWANRTALAVAAFARRIEHDVPLRDTDNAVDDLVEAAAGLAQQYQGRDGVIFTELLAAAVLEPGAAHLLWENFFAARRNAVRRIWQTGVDRGEFDPDVDPGDAIDLLFGPLAFRLLLGRGPTDPDAARQLARCALHGLRAR